MFTVVLQVLGWLVFLIAWVLLGAWLRRHQGKKNAEDASRILHFVFFAAIFPPVGLDFFSPGLTLFDREPGLAPLPRHPRGGCGLSGPREKHPGAVQKENNPFLR